MTPKRNKHEPSPIAEVAQSRAVERGRAPERGRLAEPVGVQPRVAESVAVIEREQAAEQMGALGQPLRCVWSGFPSHEHSCRARIPASVVVRAWHREMQLKDASEGFFHFSWRSGVWLGYGLADGGVRGVYCPTHRAERESRGVQEPQATSVGSGGHEDSGRPSGVALH